MTAPLAFTLTLGIIPPATRFSSTSTEWKTTNRRVRSPPWVRASIQPVEESSESSSTAEAAGTDSTPKRKLSRTEQMAVKLGKDTGAIRAKAEEQRLEGVAGMRYRYGLALASTIISTSLFFMQYLDPNGPTVLMHYMQESSAPVEIVGTNGKPSLVEFGASWCENCKAMARDVFALENEFMGKVNFVVLDGDKAENQETLDRFGVDGIPQFAFVGRDGNVETNLIGKIPKQVLAEDLRALLKGETLPYKGLALDALVRK